MTQIKQIGFFPKQLYALKCLDDPNLNEVLYGGGAGGGKSWLGCYWLVKNCIRYPGTRWLAGRNKLKRLKETTLKTLNQVLRRLYMKPGRDYRYVDDVGYFFYNGSEIVIKDLAFKPSDPDFDDLGSLEITGGFVDEVGQIVQKCWETLTSRIRFRLNDFAPCGTPTADLEVLERNKAGQPILWRLPNGSTTRGLTPKLLGSCNPSKGWVYKLFYEPHKKGTIEPHRIFIQALVDENIFIDTNYVKNLDRLSDLKQKDRLRNGNWEYNDDANQLIPTDAIIAFVQGANDVLVNNTKQRFITADIARFGSDKSVIMVWEGWAVIEMKDYDKNSITDITRVIKSLMTKWNIPKECVVVDEDGVGGGVVDLLDCVGFVNNSKPLPNLDGEVMFENYRNLKAQCGYKAATILRDQMATMCIDLTSDQENNIIEELAQLQTFEIDADRELRIKPKEKIKAEISRSPDYLDNIIMRAIFEYIDTQPKQYKGMFF